MDIHMNSISQISATPSENDVHNIKLLISECEVNISNIDEEIHTLLKKRKKWITQLHAFKMALCPAMRLPPEIVAEIFIHVRSSQKLRGVPFHSVFLSICRRWRRIAISTPALWSEMELDLCYLEPRFSNQMVLLQNWCEWAGAYPLSVTLFLWDYGISIEVNPIPTLLPHLSNISTLRLTLPSGAHFHVLFALPQDSFPSLEVFDGCLRDYDVRPADPQTVTTFKSAYRLRSMQFECDSRQFVLRPPSQLPELILRTPLNIPECLCVLCDCPDLEVLELEVDWRLNNVAASIVVLLPCLRKFKLTMSDYNICGVLFDHITLPALRELDLNCDAVYQLWCHTSFQSLASRSSWNLEHLTIRHALMSYQQFYECFGSLPSLIELNINYPSSLDARILAALTYTVVAVASPLPKLQKFRLRVMDDLRDESEAFVDMVESRWWLDTCGPFPAICRLQEVALFGEDGLALDESQLHRLKRCRR